MKKITVITLCLTTLFAFQACKSHSSIPEGVTKGQIDTLSMAVGLIFDDFLKNNQLREDVNYELIFKTMKSLRKDKEVGITVMQISEILNNYLMKKQILISEKNLKEGTEFLAKNKTKEGVVELPNGLQYKIIEEGTGIQPEADDAVVVHYTGTFINGTKFDSSLDRGEPITAQLSPGYLIQGWIEGFQHLKVGTKAILYIPAELGYGAYGQPPHMPGNSTLIFEVELIDVKKAEKSK